MRVWVSKQSPEPFAPLESPLSKRGPVSWRETGTHNSTWPSELDKSAHFGDINHHPELLRLDRASVKHLQKKPGLKEWQEKCDFQSNACKAHLYDADKKAQMPTNCFPVLFVSDSRVFECWSFWSLQKRLECSCLLELPGLVPERRSLACFLPR